MDEFEIKENINELSNQVIYLIIRNKEDCERVIEILKSIKSQRKKIIEYWSEAKENSKNTYKSILAKEKEMLTVCDEAEKTLKSKILEYKRVEEQKQMTAQI